MPSEDYNESPMSTAVAHENGRSRQTGPVSNLRARAILTLVLPPVLVMLPPINFFFLLAYLGIMGEMPLAFAFLGCLALWVFTIPLTIHVYRSRSARKKWPILDFLKYDAVIAALYLPCAFAISTLLSMVSLYLMGGGKM